MAFVGEVEIDQGGFKAGVSEGAPDEAEGDAGFEQRGGIGMPQGMDGDAGFRNFRTLLSLAEGALDAVSAHGFGGGCHLFLVTAGGGKEPGRIAVGLPGGAQLRQGLLG